MKRTTLQCLSLACMLCAWEAAAQDYSIDWYAINGGGGTSTGGVYSVSGTIGQPAPGAMSGGNFSIQGGFWSFLAVVPTPNAPSLRLVLTTTNTVVLAWPVTSTVTYLPEENPDVAAPDWTGIATPPAVVGQENQVVLPPPSGNRFYRLKAQ
jgi:hypothetical protein